MTPVDPESVIHHLAQRVAGLLVDLAMRDVVIDGLRAELAKQEPSASHQKG